MLRTHKQTETHTTVCWFDNCHLWHNSDFYRRIIASRNTSFYTRLMMWGSVANVNSLYSHRVLRWDTSTEVIPSSTAKSYPLRQPGEMCASSLSRISKIRSGPPLGGWFSLFNKIAKTQTGPSWTRSKSGLSSKSTGSLKSDRLVDRSLSLPSLKKQSSSTS